MAQEASCGHPRTLGGFLQTGLRKASITWPESVDGALCFGWIDGIRKSIDEISYKIRFTPRRPRSAWSAINVKRVKVLSGMGLMRPAGLAAFKNREGRRTERYSYEQQRQAKLPRGCETTFGLHPEARKFFRSQAPWYQRTCSWWVVSAKKEETRAKRLALLIECSEQKRRIPALTRPSGK